MGWSKGISSLKGRSSTCVFPQQLHWLRIKIINIMVSVISCRTHHRKKWLIALVVLGGDVDLTCGRRKQGVDWLWGQRIYSILNSYKTNTCEELITTCIPLSLIRSNHSPASRRIIVWLVACHITYLGCMNKLEFGRSCHWHWSALWNDVRLHFVCTTRWSDYYCIPFDPMEV